MCELNQLKKKLHLKKLIDFLSNYRFIVFYQCKTKNTSYRDFAYSHLSKNVLFLVKGARIRKLAKENNYSPTPSGVVTSFRRTKKTNNLSYSTHVHKVREKLGLLSKGSAMGSTLLVGCDSLESMQDCIAKCSAPASLDYVCLGGIHQGLYLNSLDCFRLSKMQVNAVQGGLLNALNALSGDVVKQLISPGLLLLHSLGARLSMLQKDAKDTKGAEDTRNPSS